MADVGGAWRCFASSSARRYGFHAGPFAVSHRNGVTNNSLFAGNRDTARSTQPARRSHSRRPLRGDLFRRQALLQASILFNSVYQFGWRSDVKILVARDDKRELLANQLERFERLRWAETAALDKGAMARTSSR
jgi:hypothetical protein